MLISRNEGQHEVRIATQTQIFWQFMNAAVITQGSLKYLNGSIMRKRQSSSFMSQDQLQFRHIVCYE